MSVALWLSPTSEGFVELSEADHRSVSACTEFGLCTRRQRLREN